MPSIYIIERSDFQNDYDDRFDTPREKFVAAHATLEAANKHAQVLFHRIYRSEGDEENGAEIEVDEIQRTTYTGTARLSAREDPDGPDSVTISVLEKELKEASWSPFLNEAEEREFMKATADFSRGEEEGDDSGESESEGEDEEEEEDQNSPPKATGKHARTSSATVADDGAKKKAKRTNAK